MTQKLNIEKQKKPSSMENDGGLKLNGICVNFAGHEATLPSEYISFTINDTITSDINQALKQCINQDVILIYDTTAPKKDDRIIKLARDLKLSNPDIKLYKADSKSLKTAPDGQIEGLEPFNLFEYSTGAVIETAKDAKDKEIPPLNWYVPDIFPSRGLVLVASEPKLGKSSILLDFCYCLANGGRFWGAQLEPTTCAYIDMDSDPGDTKARLEYFDDYYNIHDNRYSDRLLTIRGIDNNGLISVPKMTPIETEKEQREKTGPREYGTREYLEDLVLSRPDIKVIVLDTTEQIKPDIPARTEQATWENKLHANLRAFAEKYNITLILVTHTRKDLDLDNPLSSIRGSVGIQAATTQNIVLYKNNDGKIYMDTTSRRAQCLRKQVITKVGDLSLRWDKNTDENIEPPPFDIEIVRALDYLVNQSPKGIFEGTAADILGAMPIDDIKKFTATKITTRIRKAAEKTNTNTVVIRHSKLKVEFIPKAQSADGINSFKAIRFDG